MRFMQSSRVKKRYKIKKEELFNGTMAGLFVLVLVLVLTGCTTAQKDSCSLSSAPSSCAAHLSVEATAAINYSQPMACTSITGIEMEWIDVCDKTTKTCGVSRMNCRGFGELSMFLSKPNPLFTHGWTLYINPYQQVCYLNITTGTSNCTIAQASSADVDEPIYFWEPATMHIDLSNITIVSLYADTPVQFKLGYNAAMDNFPYGHVCVVAQFTGEGVHVENIHFNLSECATSGFVVAATQTFGEALVPIQFISGNANRMVVKNVRATGAFAAVLVQPASTATSVSVDGASFSDIHIRAPTELAWLDDSSIYLGVILMAFTGDATTNVTDVISVWNWKYPTAYPTLTGAYNDINVSLVVAASPHSIQCPTCPTDHDICNVHLALHDHSTMVYALAIVCVIIIVVVLIAICVHKCCKRCCGHAHSAALAASLNLQKTLQAATRKREDVLYGKGHTGKIIASTTQLRHRQSTTATSIMGESDANKIH